MGNMYKGPWVAWPLYLHDHLRTKTMSSASVFSVLNETVNSEGKYHLGTKTVDSAPVLSCD